jgi:6-pyruvoyltetrahydropterin/6-carboxytetrahydropterin synthase
VHTLRFDGWKLNLHFSAAHCIPFHEKCERLHGHQYAVHMEIEGELDKETGWVVDFTNAKKALKEIAGELDHRVLIPTGKGRVTHEVTEQTVVMGIMDKRYTFPREDCVLLDIPTTTAEHLAAYILNQLVKRVDFPVTVHGVRVGVDEGYGQGAWTSWRLLDEED